DVLRITEVLDVLAKLPEGTKKLLILDATQGSGPLRLMLHNDFSRHLRALDERIEKIPNLVVISSTDVDQVSWSSEEWRSTAFGHFVVEAFKGALQSPRVRADQFFDYVRDKVQRWSWDNRDAVQTPILLPSKGGRERAHAMEVILGKPDYTPSTPSPAGRDEEKLRALWEGCEKLAEAVPPPAAYSPHLWRQYRDRLLRYEQLTRAGASDGVLTAAAGKIAALKGEIEKAQRPGLLNSTYSALPMPAVLGAANDPAKQ